jgi:hypothetical protein
MEEAMIGKLIAFLILGILSGVLSFYNKNFYVKVFNDILGREEDADAATRVGRGFIYGFLFIPYFVLLLAGLAALIFFLIVAGIIAAIIFVLVWVTEKLLPNQWIGSILLDLFEKVGMKQKAPMSAPVVSSPVETEDKKPE